MAVPIHILFSITGGAKARIAFSSDFGLSKCLIPVERENAKKRMFNYQTGPKRRFEPD